MIDPLHLGPVPASWRRLRLKDVAFWVNRGVAPDYSVGRTDLIAFNQKCVRPDLSIAFELGRPVVADSVPSSSPSRLEVGDIVVNSTGRGTLGRAGLIRSLPATGAIADGHVTVIRVRESLAHPRFLAYLMATAGFYEQANTCLAVGATNQTELNRETLRRMRLVLPPIDDQLRIADALDILTGRIDNLLTEQRALVALIRERRTAELDGWVEHGGRVDGLMPVDSPWLDAVPAGWQLVPLKRRAQRVMVGIVITPSAFYEESGVPVLRGLNIRPGRVNRDDLVFMSDESNELHAKSVLRSGDIVVVRTGDAGVAAVVPEWAVGGNAVDLLIVRPGDSLVPSYLEHVLNSRLVQRQVASGSVGALQSHFNTSSLANVVVTVPPADEQEGIARHLNEALQRYDDLVAEAQRQIGLLYERRQALIATAVSGGFDALPGVA